MGSYRIERERYAWGRDSVTGTLGTVVPFGQVAVCCWERRTRWSAVMRPAMVGLPRCRLSICTVVLDDEGPPPWGD